VSVFDLIDQIAQTPKGLVVQTQLAKAASSAAANYRAAQRARSRAEFISKLSISLEEIDESAFGRSVPFPLVHGDLARSRSFLGQNQPTNQQPQQQPYPDFPPRMPAKLDP
jgi:23S rRNA-intervening sequence protein